MFSPEGFMSIGEIESQIRAMRLEGFTSADLHERLSGVSALFVFSPQGLATRVSKAVLVVGNDGEYVFVSRDTWTINLDHLREVPESRDGLDIGVFLLSDDLEDPDCDPLWGQVRTGLADLLVEFEGSALIIKEEEANEMLDRLKGFQRRRPKVKPIPVSDDEAEFKKWVSSFAPDKKPTGPEREAWCSANGIPRARGRELAREFAPDHWSRKGRPQGTKSGKE